MYNMISTSSIWVSQKKSANFAVCLYAKNPIDPIAQALLSLTKEQAKCESYSKSIGR